MAESSLAAQRSKRQKLDKNGRLSALEKLKQLKGSKNKYKVDDMDNIYDEVDEESYSKAVLDRQYDDWIVDDGGGSGYVEDGREIFDDDLDDESVRQAAKREQTKGPRKRKRETEPKKGSITSMFSSMAGKKKAEEKIDTDDILGDLLSELKSDTDSSKRKDTPRSNKFLTNKTTQALDDDKLLNNLIKSELKKPKTVLDDLEHETLYDKPKKSSDEPKPSNEKKIKPKIISEEIIVKPNTNNEIKILKQNIEEKVKTNDISELEENTELLNFDDDFTPDSFTNVTSKNETPITNSAVSIQSTDKNITSNEDLNQYIGDISDFDFGSTEIDSSINQTTQDKSQMWKEKGAELVNDDIFAKAWEEDFSMAKSVLQTQLKDADEKMLPLPTIGGDDENEEEKMIRFFWWDAFEDPYKQPGVVYLFGKIFVDSLNEYVSCCISVKNIPRKVYLLPRDHQQEQFDKTEKEKFILDIYNEFKEYTIKRGINDFRSKDLVKNYAFERKGVPIMSDYLLVEYPATEPAVESDFSSPLIEAVFGTSVNALELFLIERNIKGPCWLNIKAPLPVDNRFSWCKVQAICTRMENITVAVDQSNTLTIPPIVMATINVQVSLNPVQQKNEIVNIGLLLHNKFQLDKAPPKPPFDNHYCFVTHPRSTGWPIKGRDRLSKITKTTVIQCETELELFEKFLETIHRSDPDVIVGYDCGFQFDVLVSKILALKVKNWSCLGKLKRFPAPYFKGKINLGQIFCGRPVCDVTTSAKELNLKVKSYDLSSLCVAVLKKKEYECKEIKPEDCPKYYSSVEKLEKLIGATMMEASYIIRIVVELNILPLALQITNIAGNTLSRTLSAGRAERNEFLLLHAFHNKNYITPDKRTTSKKKEDVDQGRKKKPAYAGGLVLDPKKGFYDKLILLMDFNSLYPSIIQEFNLCFTTVPGAAYEDVENLSLPESSVEPGIIPTEIRKLVESRVEVKKLMKLRNISPELRAQYNIRQMALKLTANSMYGCLGATHCRFYAKGLAALVTMKGREILQNTKTLVEKCNYEVIYGDTDSIMINTNILEYDQVFNIGKDIKKEVNKLYKKVELDIDGVFRYLLLLQKKKYAAVSMSKAPSGQLEYTKELKGLDIVRRDWCGLACDIGNQILDQLLSDQSSEDRLQKIFEILQIVGNNLRDGNLPLSLLVITKQLSKNPNEYPNDKKLSHVLVALRLNESGGRKWKAGDTVPYIICEDGTDKTALERAYHVEEFKKSDSLKVDINYYLLNQIHPVVLRICDPIEGIDDVLIAQNLGIGDKYKPKRTVVSQEEGEVPLCIKDNRYENCQPLKFLCRNENCKTEIEISTPVSELNGVIRPSLAMCTNPECDLPPWKYAYALQNKLQIDIRKFVTDYYYGEVECENPICSKVMRRIILDTNYTFPKCYNCADGNVHRIYKETDLFNQLSFYLYIFTLNQTHLKNLKPAPSRDLLATYDTIKEFVEKQMQCNAYSVVDLTKLFWPHVQESNVDIESKDMVLTLEVENSQEDEDFESNE
ncbi:DNA polymerase alpha catalytic subunit [Copidosoma floridanum]|uniref:DNA polymerase alpha catalytic subunit n=1 Tax=Copidosoma floridanum TaxID=29053 RepID=UPI0006C9E0EE|nr:DNA polymerase alpha catalytic subunit [Copidosoma floridanum]XP_014213478.1 DNA polymerase alpha catalytic subunit [Copidosoma floridanum]